MKIYKIQKIVKKSQMFAICLQKNELFAKLAKNPYKISKLFLQTIFDY